MSPLFKKPAGMRWVDLCIYIDNNFYTENRDEDTCFTYMYLLAYMLASKARYFNNEDDYDGYATYLAWSTYQRMIDPNKKQVKSVLNYMKSIMYFRKVAYARESFSEIIDPEYNTVWNSDLYRENCISQLESANHEMLEYCVRDVLKCLPKIISQNIPRVYQSDKILKENLYISSMLTFLNMITLPLSNAEYIKNKKISKNTFDDLGYFSKHQDNDLILWHLPVDMESVVQVIINRTKTKLIDEIRDISSEFKISDDMFDSLSTDILFGDSNEGQEYN